MMFYNKFIEKVLIPVSDYLLGTSLSRELKYYREIQWLSNEELVKLQKDKLRKLLIHASNNVPFYQNQNQNLKPSDDVEVWLKKFPIIYKDTIKENPDSFVFGDKSKLIKESSSGSSGIQGSVYLSKKEESVTRAIQLLWWEWAGYNLGDKIIQTGMTTERGFVKSVKDFLFRTDYQQAYNIDPVILRRILDNYRKDPKKMLLGYASSHYVLAQFARDNGYNDVHFESVVSWGDKMFDHYKKIIESQFNTKVFDTYACTEGLMVAAQCKEHNYHIMSPQVFVEILDEEGNEVKPGEQGLAVITRLDNYSMPLIRYYLGDLIVKELPDKTCSCGRNLPLLRKVIGRDTDIVKTQSGKFLIVHFFTGILEHFPEIKQFRVVQRNLNEMEIEYIPDLGFNENVLEILRKKIHEKLCEEFPIVFVKVNSIPSTSSGKPQIIQSFIEKVKL